MDESDAAAEELFLRMRQMFWNIYLCNLCDEAEGKGRVFALLLHRRSLCVVCRYFTTRWVRKGLVGHRTRPKA